MLADGGGGVTGRTVAIIQARMTSTRLRGKVMADLCGRPLLERMVERVRRARRLDEIVVATTANATDDPIVALCESMDVATFRGDEADVLGRFRGAAAAAEADVVVRLTADCPIHDPKVIDDAIAMFASGGFDYVSNVNVRSYPDGLDVEVMTRPALDLADREARHPFLREHVTPYIRGCWPELGAGDFRRGDLVYPVNFSHVRWTVDTADDLGKVRRLFALCPPDFTWLQALAAATREPELLNEHRPHQNLTLRRARLADAELLFEWVNEPSSLAAKLATRETIEWTTHLAWLRARLADPDCGVFVAEIDGIPVGQVRAQAGSEGYEVDVYVPPHRRKRGVAKSILDALAANWSGRPLIAKIRRGNEASLRTFSAAGYLPLAAAADHVALRLDATE